MQECSYFLRVEAIELSQVNNSLSAFVCMYVRVF